MITSSIQSQAQLMGRFCWNIRIATMGKPMKTRDVFLFWLELPWIWWPAWKSAFNLLFYCQLGRNAWWAYELWGCYEVSHQQRLVTKAERFLTKERANCSTCWSSTASHQMEVRTTMLYTLYGFGLWFLRSSKELPKTTAMHAYRVQIYSTFTFRVN